MVTPNGDLPNIFQSPVVGVDHPNAKEGKDKFKNKAFENKAKKFCKKASKGSKQFLQDCVMDAAATGSVGLAPFSGIA